MSRSVSCALLASFFLLPLSAGAAPEDGAPLQVQDLRWQTSLDQARKVAKRSRQPIFHFQVLGELTGYM